MVSKIINTFVILILLTSFSYAAEKQVTFSDARILGMGNTFTAVADDKNMLFFNPAGFATYGLMKTSIVDALRNPTLWRRRYTNIGDLTVFSITGGISGFKDIFSVTESPLLKLEEMDFYGKFDKGTLTYEEAKKANRYLLELYSMAVHPTLNIEFFSYARHYFGLGMFSANDLVVQLDPVKGLYNLPNLQVQFYSDLVFPVGIGIPIPEHKDWSVGLTFKYFHRLRIELNDINDFVEFSQFAKGDYINEDLGDYFDTHSIMHIFLHGVDYTTEAIDQMKVGTGTGFDLGCMYRPSFSWRYGLLLSDVYTKINWWDK